MTASTVNDGARAPTDKGAGHDAPTVPVRPGCQSGGPVPYTVLTLPALPIVAENFLKTYELLVDGKGIGIGLCQTGIAEVLGITRQSVNGHHKKLVKNRYIEKRCEGRPAFYTRGEESRKLDLALEEWRSGNYGETVDGRFIVLSEFVIRKEKLTTVDAPALSRCHLNGFFSFPVLHQGDMTAVKVPCATGFEKVKVFEMEPYLSHHGVEKWRGKVPLGKQVVSVEYTETRNVKTLKVWPPPIMIEPKQMEKGRELLESEAREATRFLLVNGSWSFGPPTLRGKVENATTDERIMSQIPDGVEPPPSSGLKIDRSTGPRELETIQESDRERARAIFDFPNFTAKTEHRLDKLEEGDRRHFQQLLLLRDRASLLEETMEKIVRVEERHIELLIREREQNLGGDRNLTDGSGMYQ